MTKSSLEHPSEMFWNLQREFLKNELSLIRFEINVSSRINYFLSFELE